MAREGGGNILPLSMLYLELLEKCDGQKVWVLLLDDRELCGMLRGHDENFNMILDNVKEYHNKKKVCEKESLLLNGQRILMIIPGTEPNYT